MSVRKERQPDAVSSVRILDPAAVEWQDALVGFGIDFSPGMIGAVDVNVVTFAEHFEESRPPLIPIGAKIGKPNVTGS